MFFEDAEPAELGELDGVLTDRRSAAPDEDGALRVAGSNDFQG